MLDHMLLWVARVFAIAAPAFIACQIWGVYTDGDNQLFHEYEHTPIFTSSELLLFACEAMWCGIWLICVWHRPTRLVRLLSGLTAGFVFLYFLKVIFDRWPFAWFAAGNLPSTALTILVLVGTFSMVWIALRPTQGSKISRHDLASSHPLPQSS